MEQQALIRGLSFVQIEDAFQWRAGRLRQAQMKGMPPSHETLRGLTHLLRIDFEEALSRLPTRVARRMRSYQQEIDICLTCPLPECLADSAQCPLKQRKLRRQ